MDPTAARPAILEACLRDISYDPQIDESRAAWMAEFVQRSAEPEWFVDRIRERLESVKDHWDAQQLLELAARLAGAGHESLREPVRAAFPKLLHKFGTGLDHQALVILDGESALLPIVQLVGERLLEDPDEWVDTLFLSGLEEQFGAEHVRQRLREASRSDSRIARVLEDVEAPTKGSPSSRPERPPPPSSTELQTAFHSAQVGDRVSAGRRMDEHQVREVLRRIEADSQPAETRRLLEFFRGHCLSPFHKKRRVSPTDRIRRLAHDRGAEYQAEAIDILTRAKDPEAAVAAREVLADFHVSSPRTVFAAVAPQCEANDVPHFIRALEVLGQARVELDELQSSVVSDLLDLADSPAGAAAAPVMRWVYEHARCGHCREAAVEDLVRWSVFDEVRRAECRDDAFESVRSAAGW